MKISKLMKKSAYALVTSAMVISSTFTGVEAATKVETLLANMTLEQKAAQIMQVDVRWATAEEVAEYQFGSILAGGGAAPDSGNSMSDWANRADEYQKAMIDAGKIPLLYGVDAVHGNNNVDDATMFPHNIGVSAANDEELAYEIGKAVASEVKATGANWTFTPTLGVPHNERWGRTYETFGDDYNRVSELTSAYIKGIQSQNVIATAKHFLGEGLTTNGTNQGNVVMSEEDYMDLVNATMSNATVKELLTPYKNAINNGVQSVMVTYNSFNGIKTHGNYQLVTTLLRDKLGFKGVVVSDYNGLDQIETYIDTDGNKQTASTYKEKAVACVNAGVDLLMVAESGNWQKLYNALVEALEDGSISEERINEACTRILQAKDDLGLLDGDNLYSSASDKQLFGEEAHRTLARKAVAKSLTLLKNTQITDDETIMEQLENMTKVVVAGSNANNIGNQCGGWTITWQGGSGNTTEGTTIFEGIQDNLKAKGGNAIYAANGYFDNEDVQAAIVVAGETPYAESNGDSSTGNLKLKANDLKIIETIKEDHPNLPIILVLVTGRPLTIANQVNDANISAIVSAWLPGSEGAGVADVLFGETDFSGTNPITWPWYAKDIETKLTDDSKVLYETGYGLTKSQASEDSAEKPDDPDVLKLNAEGTTRLEAETYYDSYSASDQIKLENNDTTVGNLRVGSYLLYKISATKNAVYDLIVNANANTDQANAFQLYIDDKLILDNTMTVPGQGDWTTFKELSLGTVSIPEGEHILKLLAKTKDFNLDYFDFTVNNDADYVEPVEPEEPSENVGTGSIIEEDAVKVSISSSENSGDRSWYYGNQKITNKNTEQDNLDLRTVDDSTITTINVDDTTEYNSFLGMGTSIDESTVYNLWKMSEDARYAFIKRLVDPENGSGNTLFRLTIGTADFTARPFYTYYDGTGTELNGQPDWYNETGNGFSIQKDIDYHIIDTIKLIQKAAEECGIEDDIKFFASPWTPPGWMKEKTSNSNSYSNNGLLLKGGKLSDNHINDAAKYYVRYIEEYQKLGIPIYAMTLQNEPMLEIDYPSCLVSAQQEAKLAAAIKTELANSTVLSDTEKNVKIWAFDHNPGDLNTYMNTAYNTDRDAIDGAAVHDYGGELSNMSTLHSNYNDKSIHLTERSVWGTTGMDRIVQYFRNYAESYNCWVTMLDSNISTHQWVGTPDPTAFVQDATNSDNYWATPEVYLMAQFSKYIRPGFVRVYSNYGSSNTITNVVFKNPETNELIMVAVNNTAQAQAFKVVNNSVQFNATLPAYNCATYRWNASDSQITAYDVPGTIGADKCTSSENLQINANGTLGNLTSGASADYFINVKEEGTYNVLINVATAATNDKVIELKSSEGTLVSTVLRKFTDDDAWNNYKQVQIQIKLKKGVQRLTLSVPDGSVNIKDLTFKKTDDKYDIPGYISGTNYCDSSGVIVEDGYVGAFNTSSWSQMDYVSYRINVQKAGTYPLVLEYSTDGNKGNFWIELNGKGDPVGAGHDLPATENASTFTSYSPMDVTFEEAGEYEIKLVPNMNAGFNLKSISIGASAQVINPGLKENELDSKSVTVLLSNAKFNEKLDSEKWTLEGLPEGIKYELERVDDTVAKIVFSGKEINDYDNNQSIKVKFDASEIGGKDYYLSDKFIIIAYDDSESIADIEIGENQTSFKVEITGGTFNKNITKSDIELSDSLSKYLTIENVSIDDGSLNITVNRKDNYVDVTGTITIKPTGYSDGNVALEAQVNLPTNAIPTPIVVSSEDVGKLTADNAYDSNGSLASTTNGSYENFYIDVKEAGDYVLSFDITNNEEMTGALSINGGLGVGSTNNLASISFGKYYNNSGISYKTLLHFDTVREYTLQLKANNTFNLTNAKLSMKPDAIEINGDYTLTVNQIIDGSDSELWAIEKNSNIGYTGTGSYQDYFVNVTKGGKYKFSIDYSTTGTDSVVELISVVNGKETSLGTINLDSTGGWTPYSESQSVEVNLPEGEQILRVKVNNGGFNTQSVHLVYNGIDEPIDVITPVITAKNDDSVVYVDTEGSIIDLLGISVTFDGNDVTNDTAKVFIDTDFDVTKAGEYKVKVIAKDSQGNDVTKEFTITVVNKATLTYDNSEITIGSEFDPLTNITVKDIDDTDITDKVVVEKNNVDLSQPGTYTVEYSVIDALGNKVLFEREVIVVADTDDSNDNNTGDKTPDVTKDDNQTNQNTTTIVGTVKTSDEMNISVYVAFASLALLGILYGLKKRQKNI